MYHVAWGEGQLVKVGAQVLFRFKLRVFIKE